jgi:hypothetical protein
MGTAPRERERDAAVKHLTDTINTATRLAIPLRIRTFKSIQDRTATVNYYLVMSPKRGSTPRHTD